MMEHTLLARQPLYNRDLDVVAYELLFRADQHVEESLVDLVHGLPGDTATELMLSTLNHIELDKIIGEHLAFINFTRAHLLKGAYHQLPTHQVVIEVLENIQLDDESLNAIESLVNEGYQMALDDFVYKPEFARAVALAAYIKVDVYGKTREALEQELAPLKATDAILIAEKVETERMYQLCRELGFDWFQGYYFQRPRIINRERLDLIERLLSHLSGLLREPRQAVRPLLDLAYTDSGIWQRLRHLLALDDSCGDDAVEEQIELYSYDKAWLWVVASVLITLDQRPFELSKLILVRARMMALLCQTTEHSAQFCFIIGLLSCLHRLVDKNPKDFIDSCALDANVHAIFFDDNNTLGRVLTNIDAYQSMTDQTLKEGDLSLDYQQAYIEAVAWGDTLCQQIIDENE